MSLDPERLEAAIRRDAAAEVRALLLDATEADRRECTRALRSLLDGPDLARLEASAAGRLLAEWDAIRNSAAFLAAALGLARSAIVADIMADRCDAWWEPTAAELGTIAGVLADRQPPWLADFADRRLSDRHDLGLNSWILVRALVRLGAIERPDVPQYTTKMPGALCKRVPAGDRMRDWHMVVHVQNALLADPGLLDDEVWRLFTVPDAAAELARYGGCWEEALTALSEQGRLDRGRLLDACLDAFTLGLAPNRVGWYVTLHDRMSPSLEEMAARSARYLKLLETGSRPAVKLGQKACGRLLEAGLLPPEDLLAASGSALLFPLKTVAAAQLKLVARVATEPWPLTDRALATAAMAFGHERLDIQEAALDLITRWGLPEEDPERGTIIELAASLAPALAREAAALGLPDRSRPVHVQVPVTVPAGTAGGESLPPPLDDPDELVQLLTQLMEDASDALAVERAVAGAVRLCGLPGAERARLAGPLLKRAERRLREDYDGPFSGHEIVADMAALTVAWATGQVPDTGAAVRPFGSEERETVLRSGRAKTMAGILTARIREACTLSADGRPARLLAEPEFGSGAISPDCLLGRLRAWTGRDLPRYDLETALLRLIPGLDDAFWSAWSAAHPASLPAARHAYRQGHTPLGFEPQIGPPGCPWWRNSPVEEPVVVARVLLPPADVGRDPGPAGSHCWALLTALDQPLRDFYRDYGERSYIAASYQAMVAGWPLLCPWQPELAAAHLLRPLSEGLRPGLTWTGTTATAVRGLSASRQPLAEIGHLALLTGLASAEPYARIAAAEVWAKAALDARLNPRLAADAIVMGVTGRAFKLSRVAEALKYASPERAAGQQIAAMLFAAADRLIPARPAGLYLLLELAARIGAAIGTPEPPAAIRALASARSTSRLTAAARLLSPRT
jgi:hypothetical protein